MSKISFETKISDILEEMKVVYKNDNRPWVIGYSGGKDSTTANSPRSIIICIY